MIGGQLAMQGKTRGETRGEKRRTRKGQDKTTTTKTNWGVHMFLSEGRKWKRGQEGKD
jgi:hypothetical protein